MANTQGSTLFVSVADASEQNLGPLSLFVGNGYVIVDDDVKGLGVRFVEHENWTALNPVGLDGVFEGLCPPYHPDMPAAVETFVARKFGLDGAYDPEIFGPYWDGVEVEQRVHPHSIEMVDCPSEIAQSVYDEHGTFPGTIPTRTHPGYVQAHHIDIEQYDTHTDPEPTLSPAPTTSSAGTEDNRRDPCVTDTGTSIEPRAVA